MGTIELYKKLKLQQQNLDTDKYGIFWAFDKKRFKEGLEKIHLKPGEKLVSIGGGGYGTSDGVERFFNDLKAIDERIKIECDPQDVYEYEYLNHECGYIYDDTEAIKIILSLYGDEVAKGVKRRNAGATIRELTLRPIEKPGLYVVRSWGVESPFFLWFSNDEKELGACYELRFLGGDYKKSPVYDAEGKRYVEKDLAGLYADYNTDHDVIRGFRSYL